MWHSPSSSAYDDAKLLVRAGIGEDPDVLAMLFGKFLGEGVARRTYVLSGDDTKVLKLQCGARGDFQNQAEWDLWQVSGDKLAWWLAPCVAISPRGTVLIQARCEPCPTHLIPEKLPRVLRDAHDDNWGIYQGRPVLQDYGRHIAREMANNRRSMQMVHRDDDGGT